MKVGALLVRRLLPSIQASTLTSAMGKKSGATCYAVRVGRYPGIYYSWPDAEQQVAGFSRAEYKGFRTLSEAQAFLNGKSGPAAVHSFQANPRPQIKREHAAPGPEWHYPIQQPHHQFSGGCVPASRNQHSSIHDDDTPPGCQDCMIVDPADLYRLVGRMCFALGHTTNNVAEYSGLLWGLEAAQALGVRRIMCLGDSKLVVEQVNGRWQVRNSGLQQLHARVDFLKQRFHEFSISHVYRNDNRTADGLSNDAMDGYGWEGFKDRWGRIQVWGDCAHCNGPMFARDDEGEEEGDDFEPPEDDHRYSYQGDRMHPVGYSANQNYPPYYAL